MEWIDELLRKQRTRAQTEEAYDQVLRVLDWLDRSGYDGISLHELTEDWVLGWMDRRDLIEALSDDAADEYVDYLLTRLGDYLESVGVSQIPDL